MKEDGFSTRGQSSLLKAVRGESGPLFESFFQTLKPGQSIIEFGCRQGEVCCVLLNKGLHVTLVDLSFYGLQEEVRQIIQQFPEQVTFTSACFWNLPKDLPSAQWIFCSHGLEDIPKEQVGVVLSGIAQKMRCGGLLNVKTQEDAWWLEQLTKYFTIHRQTRYLEGLSVEVKSNTNYQT